MPFQLHDAAIERNSAVHRGEETERTFAAYVGSFDSRTVFQNGQQGENRALRKISVLKMAPSLANDGPKLEAYWFEMREYSFVARSVQGGEQLIAPQFTRRRG
jgi:hypothetical protein